jgi:threonine dehydratase
MTESFIERGALNKLLQLSEAEKWAGVIAASAGNRAIMLRAWPIMRTRLKVKSTIVLPRPTPLIKVVNTRDLGGEVVLHGI